MVLVSRKGVARVKPRWEDGIFLGVSDRSDELHVGTERAMHKVRTVRRREATERVNLAFFNAVSARPWDGPKKVRDVRIVLSDVSSPAAMAEAIGKGRRLYINKADIMKHGLTDGCLGCGCFASESELKDTLKVAAHDWKRRSPRRKVGELDNLVSEKFTT